MATSDERHDRRRRLLAPAGLGLLPLACVLGVVLMLAVATLTWLTSPYYGRSEAAPTPPPAVGTVPTATSSPTSRPVLVAVAPNRIAIPALKAQAPIVDVGTTPDGELDVPVNPRTVGWWSPGAKPGAAKGTAILAGHINYAGVTGTFADIGHLRPGDEIDVYGKQNAGGKAMIKFRVTGVRTYHKTRLPYRQLFDQNGIGRMVLVTCGGPFDASTGNYLDNIVAFAVPA